MMARTQKMDKKYAVIDIGTNTVKVTVAGYGSDNTVEMKLYRDFPSGLGLAVKENGLIDVSALQPCYSALEKIKNILAVNSVNEYRCIATHALRVAKNQDKVLHEIKTRTGIEVNVITRQEEARLSLYVVMMDHPEEKKFAVVNAGGGSTEFGIHEKTEDQFFIFDFGAVSLYNQFFREAKNNNAALREAKEMISLEVKKKLGNREICADRLFAMGGSIINAGYILNRDKGRNIAEIENIQITAGQLEALITLLNSSSEWEKKKIPGMDEQRLDTLMPGILIYYMLMKVLDKNFLCISTRSISDGILYKMALQEIE